MLRRSSLLKNVLPVAAIAATMAWAGTANASLIVDGDGNAILGIQKKLAINNDQSPNPLLFVTNIYVRFSEANDSLLNIGFSTMNSKRGDFFRHPLGLAFDGPPSEDLIVNGIPALGIPPQKNLAFTTFVTIGLKNSNSEGGEPNFGDDTTGFDFDFDFGANRIVGGWFASPDSGQGDAGLWGVNPVDGAYWILVAQLTVANDPNGGVVGDFRVFWKEDPDAGEQSNLAFFDNPVPSPGALALLGLAGLVGAHRRRRR
ncbi:MAG: hypothetical protein IH830_12560 [Planctomycetes bacterium]|nr:hypothetical protein [Planctomycetota bacterium]